MDANSGANLLDTAMDAMSGLTYQPFLGTILAAICGKKIDKGFYPGALGEISIYSENVCYLYAPFEYGQLSGIFGLVHPQYSGGKLYQHIVPI